MNLWAMTFKQMMRSPDSQRRIRRWHGFKYMAQMNPKQYRIFIWSGDSIVLLGDDVVHTGLKERYRSGGYRDETGMSWSFNGGRRMVWDAVELLAWNGESGGN